MYRVWILTLGQSRGDLSFLEANGTMYSVTNDIPREATKVYRLSTMLGVTEDLKRSADYTIVECLRLLLSFEVIHRLNLSVRNICVFSYSELTVWKL